MTFEENVVDFNRIMRKKFPEIEMEIRYNTNEEEVVVEIHSNPGRNQRFYAFNYVGAVLRNKGLNNSIAGWTIGGRDEQG